jgi:hypothetical protein
MGKQRERNRIRSRLDEFPAEAREYLDQQLADVTLTYVEISEDMAAHGWEISKSAIGRYALRSNAVANRLKAAREQTVLMLAAMQDNKDLEASELGTSLLIDGLTRRLATAEEDFENLPLEKAGRLLVAIQRSAIYKERMKSTRTRACRDVEANIMKRLREQLRDDQELLQRISVHVTAAATEEAMRDAD